MAFTWISIGPPSEALWRSERELSLVRAVRTSPAQIGSPMYSTSVPAVEQQGVRRSRTPVEALRDSLRLVRRLRIEDGRAEVAGRRGEVTVAAPLCLLAVVEDRVLIPNGAREHANASRRDFERDRIALHSEERSHLIRDHRRELGRRLPHALAPLASPPIQPDHFGSLGEALRIFEQEVAWHYVEFNCSNLHDYKERTSGWARAAAGLSRREGRLYAAPLRSSLMMSILEMSDNCVTALLGSRCSPELFESMWQGRARRWGWWCARSARSADLITAGAGSTASWALTTSNG